MTRFSQFIIVLTFLLVPVLPGICSCIDQLEDHDCCDEREQHFPCSETEHPCFISRPDFNLALTSNISEQTTPLLPILLIPQQELFVLILASGPQRRELKDFTQQKFTRYQISTAPRGPPTLLI